MENNNEMICAECGAIIEGNNYFEVDGNFYCEDCYDDVFTVCDRCGKVVKQDDTVYVNGKVICIDCADECATRCYHCDEYFYTDQMRYADDIEEYFCDRCADICLSYCDDCGHEFYYESSVERCEDDDRYYCSGCMESHCSRLISEYHAFKNAGKFEFMGEESRTEAPHIGFELEIDSGRNINACAADVKYYLDDFVHLERDGSLDTGFEIISQPSTLSYIESIRSDMESMMKSCVSNGFSSHNNGNCGLHMHIDKSYFGTSAELAQAKMLIIFDRHWDNLERFSRRSSGQLHWCNRNGSTIDTIKKAKYIVCDVDSKISNLAEESHIKYEKIEPEYYYETRRIAFKKSEDVQKMKSLAKSKGVYFNPSINLDRYHAVNLSNVDTIEIRIWRGSLRPETFYATFKLTDRIARLCKSKSIMEIDKLTWDEILGDDAEIRAYWETVKNR